MPNSDKAEDKNWVLYVYDNDKEKTVSDVQAIFIYEDKQTSIYWKPKTAYESGLKRYVDRIRTGQITPTPWQQFGFLTRGAFLPPCNTFEQNDKIQAEVAEILNGWDEI